MGFDRTQTEQALARTNNNFEHAMEILITAKDQETKEEEAAKPKPAEPEPKPPS